MRNGIQFFCLCSLLILAACTPIQAANQASNQADPSKLVVVPQEAAGQTLASPEHTWPLAITSPAVDPSAC